MRFIISLGRRRQLSDTYIQKGVNAVSIQVPTYDINILNNAPTFLPIL